MTPTPTPETGSPLEQILAIAARAVGEGGEQTTADAVFTQAVETFLDATADVDAAIAIIVAVGERLGLIRRDKLGQFLPHRSPAAASDMDDEAEEGSAEGQSRPAPFGAKEEAPDADPTTSTKEAPAKGKGKKRAQKKRRSAPTSGYLDAARDAAQDMAEAFKLKTRSGIEWGQVYYSALPGMKDGNLQENRIIDGLLALGVPPQGDAQLPSYVSPTEFEAIVQFARSGAGG